MELLEIYADADGETHFRRTEIEMELHDFAPPSQPINISKETASTSSLFLSAPPGWDEDFHPTPRKQLAVVLGGKATISVSDGDVIDVEPGNFLLLNDQDSKGHLTQVQGSENATFLLVGWVD
ncbi:MAG: hypothetical protein CMM52_11020 [Rhodospirillaceae bacterium]|nr:hypothetical protein [Rhodospirillaceae bacterium]|tara:strand:+ start:16151 stop:16519 length:369 start_codon:yes stop_codon:yes gene_type:complete